MKLHNEHKGFSAIEMMVVVAIIGILAMIAIPSSMGRIIKEQVKVALPLADIAKEPIAVGWKIGKLLPKDNKAAGLPEADKIVSNFVRSVEVQDGAIHMTFGNKAHPKIKDKMITFRPAVIEDAQVVPVEWVCGNAQAPDKMKLMGENKTNVADEFLPQMCR
ncbi:MAG: pilin [Methylotenera sp.]